MYIQDVNPKWPLDFHNKSIYLLDESDPPTYWEATISVDQVPKNVFEIEMQSPNRKVEYLIRCAYDKSLPGTTHCMFVQGYNSQTKTVNCINSHGKKDPYPKIPIGIVKEFYQIDCQGTEKSSTSRASTLRVSVSTQSTTTSRATTTKTTTASTTIHGSCPRTASSIPSSQTSPSIVETSSSESDSSSAASTCSTPSRKKISTGSVRKKRTNFQEKDIPWTVSNNVVATVDGSNYLTVGAEMKAPDQTYLTDKEKRNFVNSVVSYNKIAVFKHLRQNGFILNCKDLLYRSCQYGLSEMTRVILETQVVNPLHRADVNAETKHGWTAMEIAALNGRYEILKMMVQQFCGNINQENTKYQTNPLEYAIEGGHLQTFR